MPGWQTPVSATRRAVGLVLLLIATTLFVPVPLSNVVPGVMTVLIALAYLEEDGLLSQFYTRRVTISFAAMLVVAWGATQGVAFLIPCLNLVGLFPRAIAGLPPTPGAASRWRWTAGRRSANADLPAFGSNVRRSGDRSPLPSSARFLRSRTRLFLDGNPFVLCHDAEIHLPVREDHDDPSPDLHEYRVGRLRGLTGHAADFRIVGLGPPRIGNTGIDMNDDFPAIRLVRDDQFAAGRPPMLAQLGPQQISAVKGAARIRPVGIERATAPLDAVRTPFAARVAEFRYGQQLAAERASTAAPLLRRLASCKAPIGPRTQRSPAIYRRLS